MINKLIKIAESHCTELVNDFIIQPVNKQRELVIIKRFLRSNELMIENIVSNKIGILKQIIILKKQLKLLEEQL